MAAHAALAAGRLGWLLASVGAVAALTLAVALALRMPALVTGGLILLGGEYAGLFLVRGGVVDRRAPLYGAAFLVAAELAFGGLERWAGAPPELVVRRIAVLAVVAVVAVALGALVLAVSALPAGGGVTLHAAGVVAAIAATLLIALVALRAP